MSTTATLSNLTGSGATVSWTAVPGATSFDIVLYYKLTGPPTTSDTLVQTFTNQTSPATLSFTPNAAGGYYAANVTANFNSAISATSLIPPNPPYNVVLTNVITTGATVTWASATVPISYTVRIYTASSASVTTSSTLLLTQTSATSGSTVSYSGTANYYVAATVTAIYSGGSYTSSISSSVKVLTLTTVTFNTAGSTPTWTVPSGVTSVTLTMKGPGGGAGASGSGKGGDGGLIVGTLTTTPGVTYDMVIGGGGITGYPFKSPSSTAGGYPNGGSGGASVTNYYPGGGGGGYTRFIRYGAGGIDLWAGGGGGGGGNNNSGANGGDGGSSTAASGSGPAPGGGGSQSAGGASGSTQNPFYEPTPSGGAGRGGSGSGAPAGTAGGGMGWYGGGAGLGGGGGSSYINVGSDTFTTITNSQGGGSIGAPASESTGGVPNPTGGRPGSITISYYT